jgi:diadenosine tetraphosphate (Ap4A) HIT family hydrolase
MPFQLHPKLAADTHFVRELENCQVLLMDDARYPWLVLVPQVADIRELYELSDDAQQQTHRAVMHTAQSLAQHTKADKMNIAALGNQVPQLHIHIIARHETDAAWPGPVWGVGQAQPYAATDLETILGKL